MDDGDDRGAVRRLDDAGRQVTPAGQQLGRDLAPHGTTIVAATFPGGVVVAGDRRATMGNVIAQRDIEKVFPADDYSCVGIAGTAGLAVEMVRLFQVELEHYEKLDDDIDAILDEIDEVLESNAEDFVKSFIQKGGQ